MNSLRHICRFAGSLVLVTMLVAGMAARPGLVRCVMMDAIVDGPCCPSDGVAAHAGTTIGVACLEHIPGGVPTIHALRAPAHTPLAAGLHATVIAWSPSGILARDLADGLRLVDVRGSPPEQRLRVPTTVLRI